MTPLVSDLVQSELCEGEVSCIPLSTRLCVSSEVSIQCTRLCVCMHLCSCVSVCLCVCRAGGMVTQSDMAEAMAEIRKVDPYFSKEAFVKECEFDIIPTVLEV